MTTEPSPPERTFELWDELTRHRTAGNTRMAEKLARELDKQLRNIPDDLAGSTARPGIDGMLRFAVISDVLGRLEEAIEWRTKRAQLLKEFLEKDPTNSLGLFCLDDLRDELVELSRLYERNLQPEEAVAIWTDWEPASLAPESK